MAINRGAGRSRGQSGGGDAVTDATSQAQSTSAEPEHIEANEPEQAAQSGSPDAAGADADIQHFDTTITKIDRDGNEVISDHVMAGEELRRSTTSRYATSKQDERAEANAEDDK